MREDDDVDKVVFSFTYSVRDVLKFVLNGGHSIFFDFFSYISSLGFSVASRG